MNETLNPNPRRVLIVDDDKIWQSLLPDIFNAKGIDTVVVDSAEAAKDALEQGGVTEVVTDGLGGKWIKVVENAGGLPVRLLTTDDTHEEMAKKMDIPLLYKSELDFDDLTG